MAAPALAQTYIPEILLQQARLDNVPIGQLIEQVRTAVDDLPEPPPAEPATPEPEPEPVTLVPLTDSNGLYCRQIPESSAWKLIEAGTAVGMMACGWNSDLRSDLPLIACQLRIPRAVVEWSRCCLDNHDAESLAGLHGDAAQRRARQKVMCWRQAR